MTNEAAPEKYVGPGKLTILAPGVSGEQLGEKWKKNRNNGRGNFGWRSVPSAAGWLHVSTTVIYEAIKDGRIQFKYVGKMKYVPSSTTRKQVLKREAE